MALLKREVFICFDCESTGLDPGSDKIIELAAAKFTFSGIIQKFETLINPNCPIPQSSTEIHHITDDMVKGKPTINEVLPEFLKFVGQHILVGHGIPFDISIVTQEAKSHRIPCHLPSLTHIDTLRLARHYGQSPVNSLEYLRQHFNIPDVGAHRAMNDVTVNIEVFKNLSTNFKTTKELLEILSKPVKLKVMPLGKHKGRPFKEVPVEYLQWAVNKDFDRDLIFSLKMELKRRKKGGMFSQASNPFLSL